MTLDEVVVAVCGYSPTHVVVTGGEPMIFPESVALTRRFKDSGFHVTVETAGTVYQPVACDLMSISPKLSNSTPEGVFRAQHERLRIQPAVLRQLMGGYDYQLKFVMAREADLAEVQDLIALLNAPAGKVVLMPEGTRAEVLSERGVWIAELCKQFGYRFSPRLHVHLYGNRRGT